MYSLMYLNLNSPACVCEPVVVVLQSDAGWEEYYDYIFPEDSANQPNLKLMDMARMWSKKMMNQAGGNGDGDDDTTVSDANAGAAVEKPPAPETMAPSPGSAALPERDEAANGGQQEYDDRDDSDSSSSEEEEGGDKETRQSSDQEKD